MVGAGRYIGFSDYDRFDMAESIRSVASLLVDAVTDLNNLESQILQLKRLFIYIDTQLDLTNDALLWKNQALLVILDLEDLFDQVIVSGGLVQRKSHFNHFNCRLFEKILGRTTTIMLRPRINDLADRIKSLAKSLELLDTNKADQINDPWSNQDVSVGRGEDLAKLKSLLVENRDVCVVAIVGMGGVGKTTLAKKVYSDFGDHFDRCGWVTLSNKMELKSLLQELALQLTMEEHDTVMGFSELDLLLQLHKVQLENKCFIVLDDVWSTEVWLNLQIAFPSKDSATLSNVLITTRVREVGRMVAANSGIVHVLNGLSDDESWELISRIALLRPGDKVDASREFIGKEIARKCNGLPLAINLLGKHLSRKHTLHEWIAVSRNIDFDKWRGEHASDGIHQLLALTFMDLPSNLKHCLLYLCGFSEKEINTKMLYMLWIAEGMVESGFGKSTETVIEIADRHLQELASRGMVEVQEDVISRVRKFKSCRLNSMIRDMCLLTAKEDNFMTVIDLRRNKQSTLGSYKHFSDDKVRKLAVQLDGNMDRFSISFGQKKTEKIRSLLLTKTYLSEYKLLEEESPLTFKFYKVLRVLHLDGMNFGAGKFPKVIEKLAFLRYLSLMNCYLDTLPSSISNLLNLQTLDLRVRETCLMTIYNVLWKMGHMKHLYLPHLFRVHNDEKLRLDTLKELETLENFNSKLCVAVDLLQMINLRFLTASVHENLDDLEATIKCMNKTSSYLCEASLDVRSFHCYPRGKQSAIQKLFQCDALNRLHLEGYLGKVPVIASSNLSEILFSSSEFDQDPMPTLGKLPNLRVLVFYNYAFIGKKLLCPTLSFNELTHLKLSTLPDLENFIVEEGSMPKLSSLTIVECKNLKLLPNELKFSKNLKERKITRIAKGLQGL